MVKCCKKNCSDKKCISLDIRDITYSIKEQISTLSENRINNLKYDFPLQDKNIDFTINKLSLQKWALEESCLCPEDLQIIKEDVKSRINCKPTVYKDIIVDSTNRENWIKESPYCIAREKWEALAYKVCGDLHMDVEISTACDFTFDIKSKAFSCDLISALSVYSKECDIKFKTNVFTKEECKFNYNTLISEMPSCDLDFKTYSKLVNKCNLRNEIIKEVYACNMKLDVVNKTPLLITTSNTYKMPELKFKKVLEQVSCDYMIGVPKVEKFQREYIRKN